MLAFEHSCWISYLFRQGFATLYFLTDMLDLARRQVQKVGNVSVRDEPFRPLDWISSSEPEQKNGPFHLGFLFNRHFLHFQSFFPSLKLLEPPGENACFGSLRQKIYLEAVPKCQPLGTGKTSELRWQGNRSQPQPRENYHQRWQRQQKSKESRPDI